MKAAFDVHPLQKLQVSWWKFVLLLWALSMVPTPLFPAAFVWLSYFTTGLLVLGTLGYALERYGSKAYLLFVVAFSFGVAVEWLGKTTGIPFGAYRYIAPGPNIFGVPLLVPLGWWAFTLVALALPSKNKLFFSPLALVAWDLGLDPLMVAKDFWLFAEGGVYYDVPLSNFWGWYVSGFILVGLLLRLEPKLRHDSPSVLHLVFAAQTFLMVVGLTVFYGMPLAGLVTLVAMGLCLLQTRTFKPALKL
ncbi:MAG: carotenoid biosynthesis protein [Trueperaceae bacterium]